MTDDDYTTYSEIVDLHSLFAAPIIATVDADFMAAVKFVHFIRKFGFVKEKSDIDDLDDGVRDYGKLRMVSFTYTTPYLTTNKSGKPVEKYIKHKIEVPAISLIPLPLLQVTEGDFDMNLRILGAVKKDQPELITKKDDKYSEEFLILQEMDKVNVRATLTPLNQREGRDDLAPNLVANFRSKVKIRQADIPAGIAQILSITQDANSGISKKVDDKSEDIV